MRDRYLALYGPGEADLIDRLAARAAVLWQLNHRIRVGSLVLVVDATTTCIEDDDGVIVGHRFPPLAPAAASKSDGPKCIDPLLDGGWGDYVAFRRTGSSDVVEVIRAPAGCLAAYGSQRHGVLAIASDVEILLGLGLATDAIDWQFVADHLSFAHLRGSRTGLRDITEILGGEAVVLDRGDIARQTLWTPWRFAEAAGQFKDIETASASLREVVSASVSALAHPHGSILLELSGGLDSSILAACLAGHQDTAAINLVTPRAEGDERRYARLVGARTGIAISEVPINEHIDLTRPVATRTPRPGLPTMLRGIDDALSAACAARPGTTLFSGTGGDNVFCALAPGSPVADSWCNSGPSARTFRTLGYVAEIHDIPVWTAARLAWRALARRGRPQPWPRSSAFLAPARLPPSPPEHPWLAEPPGTRPGTRRHVRSIMMALAHLDGYPRQTLTLSAFPLLSQPVIEISLRIPTWMWVDGGRDRAVARHAFAAELPREIIDRRTKGSIDALCVQVFSRNRVRLRDYLLEGHLARHEFIDSARVDEYLTALGPVSDDRFYSLLPLIDTEAWLRGWIDGTTETSG